MGKNYTFLLIFYWVSFIHKCMVILSIQNQFYNYNTNYHETHEKYDRVYTCHKKTEKTT